MSSAKIFKNIFYKRLLYIHKLLEKKYFVIKTKILRPHNKSQLLPQLFMSQIVSDKEKIVNLCECDVQSITICHVK